ncbi:TonB-dependent receptor [Roseateles toxinivorans]|uniref:Iron complex outermembrane receptor protein n=1 Tax=Roseateles toxinivorans TaxID=270368 RepID=A0A4V3CST2_9BURK|nr:TonB-dependent receptor [Roseateles toxinivorans]TDP61878.1 iron complex outermembrane receptor protein [Roseateles toxinivorans]
MFKKSRIGVAALAALGAGLAAPQFALAQGQTLERVTVTGSSIKRLESETALPVTVITRDQIEKTGATNVEELLKRVSASAAAISDTTQGAGYATSNANLRGLGANSTLVLLNGRRLANHPFGSIGGNAAVDLNSIPFAALERVEILRDGASAVYGTDAVAGVINFITKRDYRSGEVSVRYGNTESNIGGAEKGASIAIGFGDLLSDKFNVLITGNVQKNTRLRAIEQQFYNRGAQEIPGAGPPTSGGGFPGRLAEFGVSPGAHTNLGIGSQFEKCDPTFTTLRGTGKSPNGTDTFICRFIYAATLDNLPDQEKGDIYGRATFNVSKDHQLFAEASFARNHSIGRIAPTPIFWGATSLDPVKGDYAHPMMPITSKYFPRDLLLKLGYTEAELNPNGNGLVEVALRAIPRGNRINDNTNTQTRFVFGANGVLGGWDYDTAVNISRAKGSLSYLGYVHEGRFLDALGKGLINPFGPSDAAGEAAWAASALDGLMRESTSTTTEFDFKASRELTPMAGGNMALALGASARKEKAEDRPVNADYSAGKHIGGEGTVPTTIASRTITALYGELSMPFAKGWEAGISARYDKYSDFGNTFNPRATLRFQPSKELVLRAAAGTGFRAPTLWDVNSPVSTTNTANSLKDPDCPLGPDGKPQTADPRCDIQYNVRQFASPTLKPEKSRQFSAGVVFEPGRSVSIAVDYWNILKKDQISTIGGDAIFSDPKLYAKYKSRIKRNAQGFVSYIESPVDNLGDLKTSGIDVDLRGSLNLQDGFKLGASFVGTYVLEWKRQADKGGEYTSYVGTAGDGSAVQPQPRWQHTAALDFQRGAWTFTVENQFVRGWTESATLVENNVGPFVEHRVKDSSRFNIAMGYKGIKNLNVRFGIKNITAEEPPFTAVSSYGSHAAGYAASFSDPRGRFLYGSLSYQFK